MIVIRSLGKYLGCQLFGWHFMQFFNRYLFYFHKLSISGIGRGGEGWLIAVSRVEDKKCDTRKQWIEIIHYIFLHEISNWEVCEYELVWKCAHSTYNHKFNPILELTFGSFCILRAQFTKINKSMAQHSVCGVCWTRKTGPFRLNININHTGNAEEDGIMLTPIFVCDKCLPEKL